MNLSFDLHRLLPIAAVGVVALAAAVLVARGVGGGSTAASAQQVLDRALKEEPRSAAMNMRVALTVSGRGGAATLLDTVVTGSAANTPGGKQTKSISHVTQTGNGSFPVSIDEISTGDRGYIRVDGRWYQLSPDQFKRVFPHHDNSPWVDALRFDPRAWLKDPKVESTDTHVGGVQANQISGSVDANKVLTDLGVFNTDKSTNATALQAIAALQAAPKSGTMQVFAGKQDGILRWKPVTAEADATKSTPPLRATLTFALGLDKVNEPVSVQPPANALPSARIASIPRAKLGTEAADILGPASGPTRKPSTPSRNPARPHKAAPPAKSNPGPQKAKRSAQAYVSCVQAAQDLASLDRCQALLP